jgi:hypothetical protein
VRFVTVISLPVVQAAAHFGQQTTVCIDFLRSNAVQRQCARFDDASIELRGCETGSRRRLISRHRPQPGSTPARAQAPHALGRTLRFASLGSAAVRGVGRGRIHGIYRNALR